MTDYLLEIGCEEIPARFVDDLLSELQAYVENALTEHHIHFKNVKTMATYRRLTLIISDIAEKQADQNLELKGPPKRISIGEDGAFLPPAIGFAKKAGVDPTALQTCEIQGQSYLFIKKAIKGKKTKDLLSDLLLTCIRKCSLPIAMRWGDEEVPFIRPIHWIVSLLGTQLIPLSLYDIKAGKTSYGHRFLTNNPNKESIASGTPLAIKSVDDYEKTLKSGFVIVAPKKRQSLILKTLEKELDDIDKDLLNEVTYLVEWPTVLKGEFEKRFLTLPSDVLVACMKKHQKYFPIYKKNKLSSSFYVVADNVTKKNKDTIIKGNQTVLGARLEDTAYFWEEDQKISSSDRVKKLERVVFQKGMGSLFDKKERLKQIASFLCDEMGLNKDKKNVLETAELCKSDLVSHMVYELPELQGVMGKYYLNEEIKTASSLLSKEVAQGIEDHYLPRYATDKVPTTVTGMITSLADRFDTIVCCFQNNQIPSGSQDPLGVRRALFGIFKICLHEKKTVNLRKIIDTTYAILGKGSDNRDQCDAFIKQRLKSYLLEQDEITMSYDIIDAVLPFAMTDLKGALEMGESLSAMKKEKTEKFKEFIETAVRIRRITKDHQSTAVSSSLFKHDSERKAWKAYKDTASKITVLAKKGDTRTILKHLAALSPTLTQYFDDVLVMDKDEKIKENRLSFLKCLNQLFKTFITFDSIVI